MTVIGFHASHEQVHPDALLDAVQLAEQVGFTAAMCSDHFSPWSERQGPVGLRLVVAGRGAAGDRACRSAWSTRPGSATTRRSSPRPPPP
jgi:alkanesulfonate monooxygenase SsuD/methylene tetrahydromethanopterin reductase-like flavin-dependent oxidoreductase (luciferase family)